MNQEKFLENEKIVVRAIVGIVTLSLISIMSALYGDPHILWAWVLTPLIIDTIKK